MNSRVFSPLALAAMLLFTPPALTQDEAGTLASLRTTLSALEREQHTIESQLVTKREQLVALRNRPSAEQSERLEAEAAAGQARSELAANPSPEAQARLNNAEFKLTLAERKWSKSNSEAAALSEEISTLEARLAERQRGQQSIRSQLTAAERSAQQRLAGERAERERQEQELARTRQEAEAAQAEIERLKSLLAEQAAASQAPSTDVAAEPDAAAAATSPRPPATATSATPAAAPTGTAGPVDDGSIKLTTQAAVAAELSRLQTTLAATDRRERLTNDILYAKRFIGDREVAKIRIAMHALGNSQFRGQQRLPAGNYRLVAGFDEWPMTLSDSEASAAQIFLLDRSAEASRLVLYGERFETSR